MHELLGIAHSAKDVTHAERIQQALRGSAERVGFQLELPDKLRLIESPEEVGSTATDMLGKHLRFSRVAYAEVEPKQATFFVPSYWTR